MSEEATTAGTPPQPDENLPNAHVLSRLDALLLRIWPTAEQQTASYELHKASAKGDNYLGVVWRITARQADGSSLILKVPPQNTVRRKQFFARPCFLRESLAYEHFLPLTQTFQLQHHIPLVERFWHYPQCYDSCTEEPNECIILEDLCATGYELHDRFGMLSAAHVRLVMRAYGKLHAISLALKQQQPESLLLYQRIVDIFEQRKTDVALAAYFEQLKASALDSLHAEQDAAYVKRLAAYFAGGSFFELLLALISSENCEPYAVVCHGDCWNNNILYKMQQQTPLEVRLIDWQLMRYAAPVTDLAYFFFTCTTRTFRAEHYEHMLNVYYLELSQQLIRLGASAEQLFPRAAFEAQLQQKCAAGLLMAMMVLPIVTMQSDDVPDLQAISELIEAGGSTDLQGAGLLGVGNQSAYKQRMREVILDCVDKDYI